LQDVVGFFQGTAAAAAAVVVGPTSRIACKVKKIIKYWQFFLLRLAQKFQFSFLIQGAEGFTVECRPN
jgi:hypothetical protein